MSGLNFSCSQLLLDDFARQNAVNGLLNAREE